MNPVTGNTTNHRRLIMSLAMLIEGVLMSVFAFKTTLTFREFIFPPLVGLMVFEVLFRTRASLRPVTLPIYVVIVLLGSEFIYGILYSLSYGSTWSPIASFQYLFSEFSFFLYALVDAVLMTGLAYYLIKMYRVDSWEIPAQSPMEASNAPVFTEPPATLSDWIQRYSQQIWGFVSWWLLTSLLAPVSFGLITTPVTVICLIAFGLSKTRKGIAGGILVAVSLNLVISLVRGLSLNAWCFMPFYYEM